MTGRPGEPPNLAVYVHWPYCARICPYCDFAVVRDRGRTAQQQALAGAIEADLRAQAAKLGPRRLTSIFFGGGTPSLMDPAWTARIVAACRALWTADPDLEVSLEANPTDAEAGRFADFAQAGVNRLSLGLQALDDAQLAFLGRAHDARSGRRAAEAAAAAFPRLSLDLIYGLPGQEPASWSKALREAAALGAEHLSPYQLSIEAGTPFDRAVRRGRFAPPSEDAAADLFEATQAVLGGLGFEAYEVSNHAKGSGARCRHNQACWRGEDYLGVGPGAHGRRTVGGRRWAYETPAPPALYIEQVRVRGEGIASLEALDPLAEAHERLAMGLRAAEGVELARLAPLRLVRAQELVGAGVVELSDGRIRATPAGRLVLDRVTRMLAD